VRANLRAHVWYNSTQAHLERCQVEQVRRPQLRDQRRISLSTAEDALAARFAIIEKYVQRANEIGLEQWTRRGGAHKLKDSAFQLMNELL
jgi:hypothetical protein